MNVPSGADARQNLGMSRGLVGRARQRRRLRTTNRMTSSGAGDDADRSDIAAIAAGDRAALERLYERHRPGLVTFIRRVTGSDHGLTEEVLQDTLMSVWRHAGQFNGDSRVRTWMFTIARRHALGKLRGRPLPDVLRPDEIEPHVALEPGADDAALGNLAIARMRELIERLPDHYQVVLVLSFVEQMTYAEIASVLDVPIGTVRSRISRARESLARLARTEGVSGD